MVQGLSSRLLLLLIGLVAVTATLYSALTFFWTERYLQEVTQQVNHSLAENLTRERVLQRAGGIDQKALREIFHRARAVKPDIELYLLGADGRILASEPPAGVLRESVTLQPLANFLSGTHSLPILGDDPRDEKRRAVFSVFPLESSSGAAADGGGYLYIVLEGREFDSLAHSLQANYILRLTALAAVVSLLLGGVGGFLILRSAARPVRSLKDAISAFRRAHFRELGVEGEEQDDADANEVAALESTFRQLAQKITQQMRRLKETDSLRRDLIANVSHDLRTPLASLQGYLETLILKEGRLTKEEERNCVRVAFKHSAQLGQLLSGLFELAKLEAQETPVRPEPFSIAELVQDVVQKFHIAAEKRRIQLRAHFQEDLPYVVADVSLIERVLENLIQNAFRHTPEKGSVDVRLIQRTEEVIVEVADNGAGIPEKELPYIFERFYQVGDASHRAAGRAGLGLAIVQRILELHGSRAEVESELEKGTTFRFRLPRQSAGSRRTGARAVISQPTSSMRTFSES